MRATTAALDTAYRARRFALLIGVDQTADDGFRPLRFASKDARDFGAALADPARGRFDGVTILVTPEQTTRAAVLEALTSLAKRASRADDIVVVYVSAHGTLSREMIKACCAAIS